MNVYHGLAQGARPCRRCTSTHANLTLKMDDGTGATGTIDPEAKTPADSLPEPPLVISQDDYVDARSKSFGEPALHRQPRATPKQIAARARAQCVKDQATAEHRERLRDEYAAKVASGEIRPPTRHERLIATARGHEDNESVQAARRLLARDGVDWRETPVEQS